MRDQGPGSETGEDFKQSLQPSAGSFRASPVNLALPTKTVPVQAAATQFSAGQHSFLPRLSCGIG